MTRKDYEAIAKAIRVARLDDDGFNSGCIAGLADSLACVCEADNPRFNRGTFFTACGMDSNGGEWVI